MKYYNIEETWKHTSEEASHKEPHIIWFHSTSFHYMNYLEQANLESRLVDS